MKLCNVAGAEHRSRNGPPASNCDRKLSKWEKSYGEETTKCQERDLAITPDASLRLLFRRNHWNSVCFGGIFLGFRQSWGLFLLFRFEILLWIEVGSFLMIICSQLLIIEDSTHLFSHPRSVQASSFSQRTHTGHLKTIFPFATTITKV